MCRSKLTIPHSGVGYVVNIHVKIKSSNPKFELLILRKYEIGKHYG